MERSLVLIKPDGVQRGLIGEVIARLEQRGLRLIAARFLWPSRELAEKHYEVHKGKSFYEGLINYFTSGPVMATVWEGPNGIAIIRKIMGATCPLEAEAGSIRCDFALEKKRNVVHASDSVESAQREIALWFTPEDLVAWRRDIERWVFEEE